MKMLLISLLSVFSVSSFANTELDMDQDSKAVVVRLDEETGTRTIFTVSQADVNSEAQAIELAELAESEGEVISNVIDNAATELDEDASQEAWYFYTYRYSYNYRSWYAPRSYFYYSNYRYSYRYSYNYRWNQRRYKYYYYY